MKSDESNNLPVTSRLYSVPRRYDLATMFVVSLAFALLLGVLRAFVRDPYWMAIIVGFVAIVGLAQALLFGGKFPRAASVITGGLAGFLTAIGSVMYMGNSVGASEAIGAQCGGLAGCIAGYVVGTCVGGVFLVADICRRNLRLFRGRSEP